MLHALESSILVLCVALAGVGLAFTCPSANQFTQDVWIPARDGVRAEFQRNRDTSAVYQLLKSSAFPGKVLTGLEVLKDVELNKLPAYWMEHTTVQDWTIATYFRYDEAACFSDFLGVGGWIVNLRDGCGVEHYRKAGT